MKKKFAVALLLALLLLAVSCVAFATGAIEDHRTCLDNGEPHEWGEWQLQNPDADCQTLLKWQRFCKKCSALDVVYDWNGRKGSHKLTINDVAPTCYSKGVHEETCTVPGCNYHVLTELNVTSHNYQKLEDGVVVKGKEATCTSEGVKLVYCTNPGCTAFTEKPYGPLGHAWVERDPITAPTCTEKGESTFKCSRCGQVEILPTNALGHKMAWIVTQKGTCQQDEISKNICQRCGYVETLSNGVDWKITKAKENIEHTWNEGEVLVDPDPVTGRAGQIKYVCLIEGCHASRIDPIPLAADPTTDPTTEPTTEPTTAPTTEPTTAPTTKPTTAPTTKPTKAPSGNNGHTSSTGGGDAAQPATGDNSNNVAYVVAIVAMLGLAVAAFSRKKVNG